MLPALHFNNVLCYAKILLLGKDYEKVIAVFKNL